MFIQSWTLWLFSPHINKKKVTNFFILQIHFSSSKSADIFCLHHILKVTLGDVCNWSVSPAHLARAVQVCATPKSQTLVMRGTGMKPISIYCSRYNRSSALWFMNEVTVNCIQKCSRFVDFPIMVPRADRSKAQTWGPSVPETVNSHSPFFAPWFLVSDEPVISRKIHNHHLDHIKKGSRECHRGIILLLNQNEYYVI